MLLLILKWYSVCVFLWRAYVVLCLLFFFFLMIRRPPRSTLFPYHDALPILKNPLYRASSGLIWTIMKNIMFGIISRFYLPVIYLRFHTEKQKFTNSHTTMAFPVRKVTIRSEEHTSELQSRSDLVCRLLLEKK